MTPSDQEKFPAQTILLRNGKAAVIRALRADDGDRLADFYASLDSQAHRHYWPHPLDREHAEANAAKADSPFEVVLVLELPGKTIGGYAWYRWGKADAESSTFGLCVAPECRGCGAGRLLMERVLEIADAGVGPSLMSLTCQHANSHAVELYRKLGFQVVKEGTCPERRGFAAEPQYWMERHCHS